MAALYLDREWPMETLPELYRKDRETWQDDFVWLHEQTLDYALRKLETIFPVLVGKAIDLIARDQSVYWRWKDPVLHSICSSGGAGPWSAAAGGGASADCGLKRRVGRHWASPSGGRQSHRRERAARIWSA